MNDAPYTPLFEEMDRLAPELGEEVVQQVGNLGFSGKNSVCFTYRSDKEMAELFDAADLMVCHAGIGTIINGLDRGIPLVLVPRCTVLPDISGDQQGIVAEKIREMGRGTVVKDMCQLKEKIAEARALEPGPYKRDTSLCGFLSDLLGKIDSGAEKSSKDLFHKTRKE